MTEFFSSIKNFLLNYEFTWLLLAFFDLVYLFFAPLFFLSKNQDFWREICFLQERPAAGLAANLCNVPSGGKTSRGGWWQNLLLCFRPAPTKEAEDSLSPPQQIPNWVEEVDLPMEHPSDTTNDLRLKCAVILESCIKNQEKDRLTWYDIAQDLALYGKEPGVGATKENFQRLLRELQDPANAVYLRVRHQIRGELFYPFGKALSKKTYLDHLSQIKNYGTHRSQPYKRLFQAIARQDLDLVFEGIKKRRDW